MKKRRNNTFFDTADLSILFNINRKYYKGGTYATLPKSKIWISVMSLVLVRRGHASSLVPPILKPDFDLGFCEIQPGCQRGTLIACQIPGMDNDLGIGHLLKLKYGSGVCVKEHSNI